ncbi:hypothetical protein [Chitinophaga filiformis]|uniref:Bacteriocin-type signal sequence-containing protein n=1 Tax=Chitinophaga filiformis TaxID=104663 RepID=A0ABY4IAL6_CHIFI|nr:hypothetical protein [Chitinophaga filiformis]UPK72098.1 hypothetical protein MYF79_12465 [Chitinophaga filiformis]
MSTEKKSAAEKAAKALEFEKLSENEAGQLAGGFSEAISESDADDGGFEINISKCHCTSTPVTD